MWSQNYTPLGGILPSALVAALPVVVLLTLLAVWHVRAHFAALAGLATAAAVALLVYKMPAGLVLTSAGYGAVLPISASFAASSGLKPSPISIAPVIATGAPNPAQPSMNAPKQNATSNA